MSQTFLLNNKGTLIRTRHSFYETKSPEDSAQSKSGTFSWSDVNIIQMKDFPSIIDSGCVNRHGLPANEVSSEEYYKKYEHDEVPVKESSNLSNNLIKDDAITPNAKQLTNSDLDKLEIRVFENMSKELQTDESSTNTDEYNMKLFKTTVQEIFDKFYKNVKDFEIYKQKFDNILSKNKKNVEEMEDFIKNMIKHITSESESCMSSDSNGRLSSSDITKKTKTYHDTEESQISTRNTIEAYKNENYITDSTFDDEVSKINNNENKDKPYNIYSLKRDPYVEMKMDGRNLLSESNIRNEHSENVDQIASADNFKSVAAKRLQMSKYMKQVECQSSDKIIPVKISYAKKNIHTEENLDNPNDSNKSFVNKICNFLCRKLRKTTFV